MNGQATANGADPRRRVAALLGTPLIVAAIATLGAATQTRAAAEDDPLAMFTEMMPVWTSPTCVNCHGATIPDVMPEG